VWLENIQRVISFDAFAFETLSLIYTHLISDAFKYCEMLVLLLDYSHHQAYIKHESENTKK
jgi:hypothetical protein